MAEVPTSDQKYDHKTHLITASQQASQGQQPAFSHLLSRHHATMDFSSHVFWSGLQGHNYDET